MTYETNSQFYASNETLDLFFPPYLEHQYKMTDKKRTTNLLRKQHPATSKNKGNRINQITKKKFEGKKERKEDTILIN